MHNKVVNHFVRAVEQRDSQCNGLDISQTVDHGEGVVSRTIVLLCQVEGGVLRVNFRSLHNPVAHFAAAGQKCSVKQAYTYRSVQIKNKKLNLQSKLCTTEVGVTALTT